MSKRVQHRRGTTSEHLAFVGAQGEITVDTTKKTAVVHDGSTAGGFPLVVDALVQPGSTTPRRVLDKLGDEYSVKDFGVTGLGITFESDKVQAAIDAIFAAGGGTLFIPPNMRIKCNSLINGRNGVSIRCDPTSWLDFSESDWITPTAADALFGYRGTAGTAIVVAADMVQGTNKIDVPDASLFAVGDLIELSMNSNGKWEDTSIAVTSGQLAIVTGVYTSTNRLVLSEPIFETLTVANGARVRKITPIENVVIDGLGMIGKGRNPSGNADQGLKIFFGRNIQIKNCRMWEVDTQSIGIVSCYGAVIEDNEVYHEPLGDIDIISYGVVYSSSMHVKITKNKFVNPRHGIVSSHLPRSNGYYGISRFVDVYENTVTSNYGDLSSGGFIRAHGGIATHTDAEFVDIYDNTIIGCRYGINLRTARNNAFNNKIYSCKVGIYLSEYWADLDLTGNEIVDCPQSIITDSTSYETARGTLSIVENKIIRCGGGEINYPLTIKSKLIFSGNKFREPANTGATASMSVYNNVDMTFKRNDIHVSDTLAIRASGTGVQNISDNDITSLVAYNSSSSIFIVSSNEFVIKGNTIYAPTGSTSGGIACPLKQTAPNSVVTGNELILT